jgi:DNA-directed RNA polymerase subunit RPC12/RpoP
MDQAAADAARQAEARAMIAQQMQQGIEYECGDCAKIVRLKPGDQVMCHSCGYRIVYGLRCCCRWGGAGPLFAGA